MDILKALLVRHWLYRIQQERIQLLIMDEFLPFEINLLTLSLIELDTRLLDKLIRFRMTKTHEIRTTISNRARMPYLVWIHNKVCGPACDCSVEFVIAH